MKSTRIIMASFVLASLCLSSCSKKSESSVPARLLQKDELVIAMDPRKVNGPFDPCNGWGFTGIVLFQSTLMRVNSDNAMEGDLAESYSASDDGMEWRFVIRKDARFSDGSPLTARDVAFTYNKAKETGRAIDMTRVESVTAEGDYAVVFRMKQPDSTFFYQTAVLGIVPEKSYSENYGMNPIGSGAFRLVSFTQGQQIVMERNEFYYGKKSPFRRVVILLMQSDAAFAAAKSGQVDFASVGENLITQDVSGFSAAKLDTYGYRMISLPTVPLQKDEKSGFMVGNDVTSDGAIRKALAIGIDREEIVSGALNGVGKIAYDMQMSLPWGIDGQLSGISDNRTEEASALLDGAGWKMGADKIREKDGRKAEFTLMYPPSDSGRQAIAEVFAVQAARLGIKVDLKGLELDDMKKDGLNKRNAVVLGGGAYNPLKTYQMLAGKYTGSIGWSNLACYRNPKVDAYMEQALASTDTEQSLSFWHKALWDGESGGSILGDNPYITVAFIYHNYFVRDGLSIGKQKIHPHDHNVSVLFNLNEWDFSRGE
ncbi:ABC transporter substrate-binding protein [Treponema saccharophilum]|uniref:Extracellular solute-binding protein family 5 n=2 Tax=Treponema TaxID=157 RepID=H7EJM3_9SPIR|nr:ABC transporter substrate-binding protein [Treponema saccharophilum]EIC02261.1 extracellular solute-binding protein family 5 [Treponema saccharophilum DSM 2985]BDC97271.1 ABC transporter substrate-binding protein [Treponema saccharophilum]